MMRDFVTITSTFLSQNTLQYSISEFNNLLRREQIKRNAHIMCLPFDVVLIIIRMVEGNTINLHRNISKYKEIIGKDQMHLFLKQSKILSERWIKLKDICRSLINSELENNEIFPLIILAQADTPAPHHIGTSRGRYILCIWEENHQNQSIQRNLSNIRLCEDAQNIFHENLIVSAHKCALVAKHRQNPFSGIEEFVSIQTTKVNKIWWVQNTKHISCNLDN